MTPRDAIAAYKGGEIEGPRLLRTLVSHEGWCLPGTTGEGPPVIWMSVFDDERWLQLFTDEAAFDAWRETHEDSAVDTFVTVTGAALFSSLADDLTGVNINPGSEQAIHYKQYQFELLREWGLGIEVERILAGESQHPDPFGLLKSYAGWRVVHRTSEDGSLQLALAPDAEKRPLAAVFTAPDATDAYVAAIREALGTEPEVSMMVGKDLFNQLSELPLDGIVFNCAGPTTPRAVTLAFAKAVLERGAAN